MQLSKIDVKCRMVNLLMWILPSFCIRLHFWKLYARYFASLNHMVQITVDLYTHCCTFLEVLLSIQNYTALLNILEKATLDTGNYLADCCLFYLQSWTAEEFEMTVLLINFFKWNRCVCSARREEICCFMCGDNFFAYSVRYFVFCTSPGDENAPDDNITIPHRQNTSCEGFSRKMLFS